MKIWFSVHIEEELLDAVAHMLQEQFGLIEEDMAIDDEQYTDDQPELLPCEESKTTSNIQ